MGEHNHHGRRKWTKDEILYAILEWEEEHGEPPRWDDWIKAGDGRPVSMTVRKYFGSWTNAIAEAGFEPHDSHSHPKPFHRQKKTIKLTIEELQKARRWRRRGVSNVQIASRLSVAESTIRRHLGPSSWIQPKRKLKNRSREARIADLRQALTKNE